MAAGAGCRRRGRRIEQEHLRDIVKSRRLGEIAGFGHRQRLDDGDAEAGADVRRAPWRLLAVQLEKIRLHLGGDRRQSFVAFIHHQRRQLEPPAHALGQRGALLQAQIAGTSGEEDQPAEIRAGVKRRIGGGGRIDPANFDLDRHGMGLMGLKEAQNQATRNLRPNLRKDLGFRR